MPDGPLFKMELGGPGRRRGRRFVIAMFETLARAIRHGLPIIPALDGFCRDYPVRVPPGGRPVLREVRDAVRDSNGAKIAFAGLVDTGANAVRIVATGQHDRVDAEFMQMRFQAAVIERAPARFVDVPLVRTDLLRLTVQQ